MVYSEFRWDQLAAGQTNRKLLLLVFEEDRPVECVGEEVQVFRWLDADKSSASSEFKLNNVWVRTQAIEIRGPAAPSWWG